MTSVSNSIEVLIIDENQDKVASNLVTIEVLPTNNTQKELVHSSAQLKNQHTTHLLDLSKFPDGIYFEPTGQVQNG